MMSLKGKKRGLGWMDAGQRWIPNIENIWECGVLVYFCLDENLGFGEVQRRNSSVSRFGTPMQQ
jgi:hypothetical protein